MKTILKSTLAIALLFVSTFGNAQTEKKTEVTESSLLWEISGNGLEKPSYLFGTMHMMCESDFLIKDKVITAFEKSEKLVLEVDFSNPNEMQNMQKAIISDKPLSKTLTKEEFQKLDTFLKDKMGVGAAQFDNFKLFGIMSMVMMKSLSCPLKMYEMEFSKMATAKKLQTVGLETFKEQIALFEKAYTNKEMIDQFQYYDTTFFEEMVKVYNSENLNKLYHLLNNEKFMNEVSIDYLLTIRNKNWVEKLPAMMKEKSLFIAVGAAHLPEESGVINLLRKSGYTVKSIKE